MGNSDSKVGKGASATSLTSAQAYRNKVHALLESEFDKRADPTTKMISRDGFHSCLRAIQTQFDFSDFAFSPLATGLFEISAKERPSGKPLMSISEYASAMAVLFNNLDANSLASLTNQSVIRWFNFTNHSSIVTQAPTEEMLVAFFEASWNFGWGELSGRLSSNYILNGKSECDAIDRFRENHIKFFAYHSKELSLSLAPPQDKTILMVIGDEEVQVPTSFSFISRQKNAGQDPSPVRSLNQASSAYPDIYKF
jgi:hypothetical protein